MTVCTQTHTLAITFPCPKCVLLCGYQCVSIATRCAVNVRRGQHFVLTRVALLLLLRTSTFCLFNRCACFQMPTRVTPACILSDCGSHESAPNDGNRLRCRWNAHMSDYMRVGAGGGGGVAALPYLVVSVAVAKVCKCTAAVLLNSWHARMRGHGCQDARQAAC